MTVWLVESGEYDDRRINHVAATREAAVKAVKETYKQYRVIWKDDGDDLIGYFEKQIGYHIGGTEVFIINEVEVIE